MSFVHLHTHTEYSMLDGISRIPALTARAAELEMPALAITDHGGLYGAPDFYDSCREHGIKPIIGCEIYMAQQDRRRHDASERSAHHLVLLAQDNEGYRNLIRIVTAANTEGFYYKPRADLQLLQQHSAGLICLSACVSGAVPELLAQGNYSEALAMADRYRSIFPDRYFLELQSHAQVPNLAKVNDGLKKLSADLRLPLVATNDLHYTAAADHEAQDIYVCIQTGSVVKDDKRLRFLDRDYYLKSPEEMRQAFPGDESALAATLEIAQQCQVDIDTGAVHLPKYDTPDGQPADAYLSRLCEQGLNAKYGGDPAAAQRLEYELAVIRETRFADYFLVVWDIVRYAREQSIRYGIRGSAAASVALHCLGITPIDPMTHRLVFERFLNYERKELPDVDLDFQDDRRDEVLRYVIAKYGSDRVAQIVGFQTLGAKAAIRDVGRALDVSYAAVDRLAKAVPDRSPSLEQALQTPEMAKLRDEDADHAAIVKHALQLEGAIRNLNTHPAGVLISDRPLGEIVPLQKPTRSESEILMTQYGMDQTARLGLLKMDFLGLTSLTILAHTEAAVPELDLDHTPLDDPETYRLLASGQTANCFQLESSGMQRYIRELKPTDLADISAMIALYRPGPMEHIDRFIRAKHGLERVTYPHHSLKDILDETYGVIVYQDQVLHILQRFAGYSLGAADIVRKAMGKKIPELMAQERRKFTDGAAEQGYDLPTATAVFDLIEPFAGYAFNKAHSISYALISYWTAYCKTHYAAQYLTAALNCRLDSPGVYGATIREIRRNRIPILPPDVNAGNAVCAAGPDGIRIGLAAVKNVSATAAAGIANHAPYANLDDFCAQADLSGLNRKTFEALGKAGAFDAIAERGQLLENAAAVFDHAGRIAGRRSSAQTSLFGDNEAELDRLNLKPAKALTDRQKAGLETETIGFPLSWHPGTELESLDRKGAAVSVAELRAGQTARVLASVASVRRASTKAGKAYCQVKTNLADGEIEVMVWAEALEATRDLWRAGALLFITGAVHEREAVMSLHCTQAQAYDDKEPLPEPPPSQARTEPPPLAATMELLIKETENPAEDVSRLRRAARLMLDHPGEVTPVITIEETGGKRTRLALETILVTPSESLTSGLAAILEP